MRIMGLKESVHWFTWFLLCTTVMMFTTILLVLILKFGKITQHSNLIILIIFFVSYTFATVNQCFLISVLFNRANLAACGAGIIYFLLYLPYLILNNYDNQVTEVQKAIACLSSTVAFGLGCDYIARYEGMTQGAQWFNINKGAQPNDSSTLLFCIIMMFIDSVIYILLAIYIENVFPGEYGIPQVWYYPFSKTYWLGYNSKQNDLRHPMHEKMSKTIGDGFNENEDIGIEIENLSKFYGNKTALKGVSVKFYRNMITAFLGRNGAGKSTTWAILTGLMSPSSGTAYIDGYNILTDMAIVRKRLGFAPQYNILFDLLTVREHLEFFSALKHLSNGSAEHGVKKMLHDLELEEKSESYSTELSGGMKRKLSIGIAFIGNSTTVILDEPTAGVDPYARRAIWDLILEYKPGRTIVLSTHHLDEADLLSDRLAIISSGELQCVGTTMDLKRKYGDGYNLIVELTSTANGPEIKQTNKNNILDLYSMEKWAMNSQRFVEITNFLKHHISDIKIKEQHGNQITYIIVDDVEHTKHFPLMFSKLDENKEKFNIKTYGLSNSSLEQVFLRVADEAKRLEDYQRISCWNKIQKFLKQFTQSKKQNEINPSESSESIDAPLSEEWSSYVVDRYTGINYFLIQLTGLIIKRFHRTKRNVKGLIAEILLPIIFILLAVIVIKLSQNQNDPPMLILHPWYWYKPNYIFKSLPINNNTSIQTKFIDKTFTRSPTIGTRCMKSTMLNTRSYPCSENNNGYVYVSTNLEILEALNQVNYNQTKISPECDCWEKMQMCPIGGGGPKINYNTIETQDILLDLQDFNTSDWLIKTEYNSQYLMRRFGGFEFSSTYFPESFEIINQNLINHILNITNQTNAINAPKIGLLLRINTPQVSVWYNNNGWPSSVAFLNVFNNALLRGLILQKNSSARIENYGITAINHPLPQTEFQIDTDLQNRAALEIFTAICVIFALAFIPASFLVFLIDERVTTSKHLQFASGVKGITYWCGNFLWDLTNYSISISCCMIIFLTFNIEAYVYKINFLCLLLLLFLYGFAIIPLMYSINYFFHTPSTGFVLVSCVNIFIGLITTISTYTLENFDDDKDLKRINNLLTKLFLIFPHYCLGRGLFDISRIHATNIISLKYVENYIPVSPLKMDVVGRNLISLLIQGVSFFSIAILIQYRFFIPKRDYFHITRHINIEKEDDDVANERQRIYADPNNSSNDILRTIDMVKVYQRISRENSIAVRKTCLGVKRGECFGLLGMNGSGKSTTFKMLTGQISVTDGNAFINNYSVLTQLDHVQQNIGYCPQFDALDNLLTAREHLYFYARLRGIQRNNIPFVANCLIKRLGLNLWADRTVSHYSGGNKRKLSTAIALIGNPSIIFMDEPTTGMDVRAKRFLWNCILTLTRQDQKTVVITSHSMEECEKLCNRLVIMVKGEFKCLGSVPHLKAKFGDGYSILIRTNIHINKNLVTNHIQKHIPGATLHETHNKLIHLRVKTNVSLAYMFNVLEKARTELKTLIEDYTITQVTLDDVFVNFAKLTQENLSKFKHDTVNKICPM